MKKILLTSFLILSTLLTPLNLYAQEETETEEVLASTGGESFELSIVPGIQSIFDKSIPLTLNIRSYVDTHKMEVSWKLPIGITPKGDSVTDWSEISVDQEMSTTITLTPSKPGTYNIIAEVQDWKTSEIDTTSITLTFDNNLELSPQSDEYYRNETSWFWAKVGIGIVGVTAALILSWFGFRAFRKWMDED